MPVMDGLDVIKHCRDLSIPCEFIVLSGYSEFSYIKTAMQYQSSHYLLKPIDPDELHKILENLQLKIYKMQELRKKIEEDIDFITINSIIRILKGEQKESLVKRINFILNLHEDEKLCCILLEFSNIEDQRTPYDNLELRRSELTSYYMGETGYYIFVMNHQLCMLVTEQFLKRHNNTALYSEISGRLSTNESCTSLYIGDIHTGIRELKKSYEEAVISKKHQFYRTRPCIIEYKAIRTVEFMAVMQAPDQQKILNAIIQRDRLQTKRLINELFDDFKARRIEPVNVFLWVENIKAELMKEYISKYGSKDQEGIEIIHKITGLRKEMAEDLKKHLKEVLPEVSELFSVKEKALMITDEIEAFILNHYTMNIKLSEVAEHFNFNPAYLGQLIQKKIGMSYNDYLNKIRIEKSKELLRRTDLRLNEIADSIGYNNPNYFVLKFKESLGMSPLDYRNQISG